MPKEEPKIKSNGTSYRTLHNLYAAGSHTQGIFLTQIKLSQIIKDFRQNKPHGHQYMTNSYGLKSVDKISISLEIYLEEDRQKSIYTFYKFSKLIFLMKY